MGYNDFRSCTVKDDNQTQDHEGLRRERDQGLHPRKLRLQNRDLQTQKKPQFPEKRKRVDCSAYCLLSYPEHNRKLPKTLENLGQTPESAPKAC